jgi:hypothetical protein
MKYLLMLKLSKRQQDAILLIFFLGIKNIKITILMKLAQSTIHYHEKKELTITIGGSNEKMNIPISHIQLLCLQLMVIL